MGIAPQDTGLRLTGYDEFKAFLGTFERKVMRSTGNQIRIEARRIVNEQYAKRIDYKGRPLTPYSPKYRELRRKARKPLTPNLRWSNKTRAATRSKSGYTQDTVFAELWIPGKYGLIMSVHRYGRLSGRRNARFHMPQRAAFAISAASNKERLRPIYDAAVSEWIRSYTKR